MPAKLSAPTPPRLGLPTRGAAGTSAGMSGSIPFMGSASVSIPLPTLPARSAPDLSLAYSHGEPNGPFGLGVRLDAPVVTRRAPHGIPRYDDADVFVGPDGDELAPGLRKDAAGGWVPETWAAAEGGVAYEVRVYRPRVDPREERVERWTAPDGSCFWKARDGANGVRVFGRSSGARVADPTFPLRVHQWLLEEVVDALGNRTSFAYREEDGAGWAGWRPAGGFAAKYVASVLYGNRASSEGAGETFAFELRFDYGDLDPASGETVRPWPVRADPVATCRPGFPVLALRLCRNVLLLNHLPDAPPRCASRTLELTYDEDPFQTRLVGARLAGRRVEAGALLEESLPPLTLSYEPTDPEGSAWTPMRLEDGGTLPGLAGGDGLLLADLHGDGLPGLVWPGSSSLLYFPPRGAGRFGQPQALPLVPDAGPLSPGRCMLQDVAGDGRLSLVVLGQGLRGTFRNLPEGGWGPFRPFMGDAPEAFSPVATLAGFNGGGLADALVRTSAGLRLYPSRGAEGFAVPLQAPTPPGFPVLAAPDPRVVVSFEDVLGDGLPHCVRVASGRVEVWPSLGHGRFARPYVMAGSPLLPDEGFEGGRVLLGDFCGSGRADLLVVQGDAATVYRNRGGFSFAPPFRVPIPGGVSQMDRVALADVNGAGHACLVVASAGSPARNRFLDPFPGRFPGLLASWDNGLGGTVRYAYRTSASYALEDAEHNDPWATRLPFPVVVVSRVERRDRVSGLVAAETHRYRDGWFDPIERAFQGFGYVETLAEPSVAGSAGPSQPRLTRAWYRLGDSLEEQEARERARSFQGDPRAVPVGPDRLLPEAQAMGAQTERQAWLALAGRLVRQETYAVDAQGAPAATPLEVEAHAFDVRLVQPAAGGSCGAFAILPRESVRSVYEGVADDPRVEQEAVLGWDALGRPSTTVTVSYARRAPRVAGQERTRVVLAEEARILLEGPSVFLADPTWQERETELSGLAAAGDAFSWEELRAQAALAMASPIPYGAPFTPGRLESRLFSWSQALFWDADLAAPLPPGLSGPQGLVHHGREAVFPLGYPQAVFGGRVDDGALEAAGYSAEAGHWWRRGDVVSYGGPAFYYLPTSFQGPFQEPSACTRVGYDEALLEPVRLTDALGRSTTVVLDPQSREAASVTDGNGVVTEALYDALGRLLATSRHALTREGYRGGMTLSSYQRLPTPTPDAVLADPGRYLQGALSFHLPFAPPSAPGEPPCSVVVTANGFVDAPGAQAPEEPPGVALVRVDGFGLPVETLERIEQAAAKGMPDEEGWAWRSPERLLHDGDGNVTRAYVASFAATPSWSPPGARPFAQRTLDALGREARQDDPKGFLTRTLRPDAWTVRRLDEDDTVLESPYYKEHLHDLPPPQRRALEMAAAFADTPSSSLLDPQGHEVAQETVDVEEGARVAYLATSVLDVRGLILSSADPRLGPEGLQSARAAYDMLGRLLHEWRADSGDAWTLPDATDLRLHRWSARGVHVRMAYDAPVRRPLREEVEQETGWAVALALAYGSDPGALDVDRVVLARDQSGVASVEAYDLSALPARATRRFVRQAQGLVDWSDPSAVALFDETWRQSWARGPSGAIREEGCAEGSTVSSGFYANGWTRDVRVRKGSDVDLAAVEGLRYEAWGDAAAAAYGTAVSLAWAYDPLTRELVRATAARASDGATLQDLSYVPDPVGNVAAVRDAAPAFPGAPPFWKELTFDALYRLVGATGIEEDADGIPVPVAEEFRYDRADNLLALRREVGPVATERTFAVSAASDRAVPTSMLDGGPVESFFDAAGNLLRLEDGARLAYDHLDRLATVQPADAAAPAQSYRYGAEGRRDRLQQAGPGGVVDETFVVDRARLGVRLLPDGTRQSGAALLVQGVGRDLLLVEAPEDGSAPRVRHLLCDRLGSITRELDAQGALARASDYRSYGEPTLETGQPLGPPAPVLAFSGKERDPGTGLSYFGGRHYIPSWGRWLTPDPMGDVDGPNLFAYVGGNPVTHVDPTGYVKTTPKYGQASFDAALKTATYRISKAALKARFVHGSDKTLYKHVKWQLRLKATRFNKAVGAGLKSFTSVTKKARTASPQWIKANWPFAPASLPKTPSGRVAVRKALAAMVPIRLSKYTKTGQLRTSRVVNPVHPDFDKLTRLDVDEDIPRNLNGPTILTNSSINNQHPLNSFVNSLMGSLDNHLRMPSHGGGPGFPIHRMVVEFVPTL